MPPKIKATFIDPMLLLRKTDLPEGPEWIYELKFDGYRAIAFKTGGKVHLRSRNDKVFSVKHFFRRWSGQMSPSGQMRAVYTYPRQAAYIADARFQFGPNRELNGAAAVLRKNPISV